MHLRPLTTRVLNDAEFAQDVLCYSLSSENNGFVNM